MNAWEGLARWSTRQWMAAVAGAIAAAVVIGIPTDVIPNPLFGRSIPPTWWSVPMLVLTSALSGLLLGTYVASPEANPSKLDRPGRSAGVGGLLSYFAVGCPVCNKLVVVALGTTGAVKFFEPLQPILAGVSLVLLVWALRSRLRNAVACSTQR
jgi:hypothetical protein